LETSTFVAIDCRSVYEWFSVKRARKGVREQTCCCWLPTNRPMEERPNVAREGAVPSSCQVIVNAWLAGIDEVATGSVILGED
jgi:hypothetical protein